MEEVNRHTCNTNYQGLDQMNVKTNYKNKISIVCFFDKVRHYFLNSENEIIRIKSGKIIL